MLVRAYVGWWVIVASIAGRAGAAGAQTTPEPDRWRTAAGFYIGIGTDRDRGVTMVWGASVFVRRDQTPTTSLGAQFRLIGVGREAPVGIVATLLAESKLESRGDFGRAVRLGGGYMGMMECAAGVVEGGLSAQPAHSPLRWDLSAVSVLKRECDGMPSFATIGIGAAERR